MCADINLTPEEYRAFLRKDLTAFIQKTFHELNPQTPYLHNWHIEVIADALEKCRQGKIRRLIINVPPRSLKSLCASIAFPAFVLGHDPAARIICASYGQDLARTLADDFRSVMLSDWYLKLFPKTRPVSFKQATTDFKTTEHGRRFSTSVNGTLTGMGAQFIIIDDPLKPGEAISEAKRRAVNQWYDDTVPTRINDKRTGCIILIMQRLHEDDLVGHVQKTDHWDILKFPAIAEEDESFTIKTPSGERQFERKAGEALHAAREPLDVLERARREGGECNFAGQYQQAPAPQDGGMVKLSWFKRYTPAELPGSFDLVFQSWDTANKKTELNDYSVCTTWGRKGENLLLLDVQRDRMEYPALKRAIREQAAKFQAKKILIEDKASGTQLIQELAGEGVHGVTPYQPKMEKVMRFNSITSTIEKGLVFLPEEAPWLAEYLHELATFPKGRYDDQVDSTSQALDWIKGRSSVSWFEIMGKRELRKQKIEQGDLEGVKEMDAKHGPPPEDPKSSPPSGGAAYVEPKPGPAPGPVVYRPPEASSEPLPTRAEVLRRLRNGGI